MALKGSDALHILAGAGIDADVVALVDEQRNADLSTGLDSSGLQGVGGGVALDTRLGLGDFQLDKVGDFNTEDLALIAQQLAGLVLLAELEVIGHIGSVDGDIIVGLVVHEVVQIAILIAVSHVLALDESLRELCGRVVAGLNHRAGDHVLGLGADKGSALAGLDVLELNDLSEELEELEADLYEDDEDDEEPEEEEEDTEEDDNDDDIASEPFYEVACPNCGETVYVSEDDLDAGEANCAHCGVTFEVALEDDDEEQEEGPVQYEVTCPACGQTTVFEEDDLLDGAPKCPGCGKPLDFEVTEE